MAGRRSAKWVSVLVPIVILPNVSQADRREPPRGHNGSTASGGASCRMCHDSESGQGKVEILGAPKHYQLNAQYDMTVRITDPERSGAGFQISAEDANGEFVGTLSSDALLAHPAATNGSWISSNRQGVQNSIDSWKALGHAAEYQLTWQSPNENVGPVTFWVAGNGIDDDLSNEGDTIYLNRHTATFGIDPVPTVSMWGFVAMVVLLMVAGSIMIGRTGSARQRFD